MLRSSIIVLISFHLAAGQVTKEDYEIFSKVIQTRLDSQKNSFKEKVERILIFERFITSRKTVSYFIVTGIYNDSEYTSSRYLKNDSQSISLVKEPDVKKILLELANSLENNPVLNAKYFSMKCKVEAITDSAFNGY